MQSNFKTSKQQAADPHETAIAVLGWLADDPDMFGRFLALTGVAPGQVRNAVNDPGFLAGLMDFLMNHEPTAMAFCAASGISPETVTAAWRHFSSPGLDSGEY
ncbi:DUF3572 domain-containing protein [Rhizobium johnstonii]|jgi:hypothetical protein|uniref:DUF3572 family protein n=5 Tax=Rhizobium TaxID=379 RepID=Q1MII7_RHIJ3|nr:MULTISPECIES: DUF3572 domain-containing protein [Rhizobium]KPN28075.1 hypothetical protein KS05_07015 [Rhizobium brockwellii]MBB4508364.1 hypothetical protein [Rhizobium leguminosarum]MBY2938830.1 DUF3572 domain-containing protein [Rhizobium leguminosarum]MBY2982983.1 DUF3572 domain-containing protein [Rhizobium leguminosarum]MBY5321460.1 DUF3572 domain-containing protein [Rhizobium leguminosarum]